MLLVLWEAVECNPEHLESRLTLLLELGRNAGPVDEQRLRELAEELWKLFRRFADIARETYPDEIEAIQLRMGCLRDRPAMPAAPLLRERLETAPQDNWTRLTLARRLIAEGDFAEAAERLLQGIERGEAAPGFVFFCAISDPSTFWRAPGTRRPDGNWSRCWNESRRPGKRRAERRVRSERAGRSRTELSRTLVPAATQPGGPGQLSRIISAEEAAREGPTPLNLADVHLMQHRIVHHGQAVDTVRLVSARASNTQLTLIASRIRLT